MLIPWNRIHHLLDDVDQSLFSSSPSLFLKSKSEGVSPHHPRWRDEGDVASLSLQIPGLTEEDVEVTMEGETLTIEGGAEAGPPEGYRLLRKERIVGNFRHQFTLSTDWDLESVTAQLHQGVLTVRVAKAAKSAARRIPLTNFSAEKNDV